MITNVDNKVKDYKGILRAMVSLTEITTTVGRLAGIIDNSSKETIHKIRVISLANQ